MWGSLLVLIFTCLRCYITGFVLEGITQCGVREKVGDVSFNYQVNFNRLPIVKFSKDEGKFLPCDVDISEIKKAAEDICLTLNSGGKHMLEYMKKKEKTCNMQVMEYWESTVQRAVKPSMNVFLPDSFGSEPPTSSLVCHVWGFYPSDISVIWMKNGEILSNTTEAVPVGDWTYQVVAQQDVTDSSPDDEYTCAVRHPSLDHLMTSSWRQGWTRDEIIKISISSLIFISGLTFAISGYICWSNSRRNGY
uniref:Ig-like domain-containing protein n=1 Tax=Leptobrachium leishanense TaxID=445787 RepID=A0A8C5Q924_9ANUR